MRALIPVILAGLIPNLAASEDIKTGKDIFSQYCMTCHGLEARGNGPMSPILTILPSDLTQLSKNNDGSFPRSYAISKIDGRDPILAHGSPMPVYGPFFEGRGETIRGDDGVLIMTSQPIIDLIAYLESIQE